MKKILALCLILIVLSFCLLTSCSGNNYKPISLKYQNFDYAPYTDGEPKSFLVDLLNNSKWHNDVAKCNCDYSIVMKNSREIFYHSEFGTFIDYDFDKSLTISEEDRMKLNDYFADIMCRSSLHFFDENNRCTACGYITSEQCNHQWDEGIEIEGGSGGYVMEYTCLLCGNTTRETITIIPPEN